MVGTARASKRLPCTNARRGRYALGAVVLLQSLCAAALGAEPDLTPQALNGMLASQGPSATAQALTPSQWRLVLAGMRAGNPAWLALAPRLKGSGNASGSEGIEIALSDALSRNPRAVLQLLGSEFSIQKICGDRHIEPHPDQVRLFYASTIPALQAVQARSLRSRRDECLAQLHATQIRETQSRSP